MKVIDNAVPLALSLGLGSLGLVALAACGSVPRAEPVSTTTTTAAPVPAYTPGEVELYAVGEAGRSSCSSDVGSDVDFAPQTADLLPGEPRTLDRWASCLKRPELAHTTIVLLGGESEDDPSGLFVRRAGVVRTMLLARGIDPQRVLIGATNATREGGSNAVRDAVRVEPTHVQVLRVLGTRSTVGVR